MTVIYILHTNILNTNSPSPWSCRAAAMIGEEWKAVKEQVELIATEVVEWNRTKDVIYSLQQQNLLTPANVGHLMVCEGEGK